MDHSGPPAGYVRLRRGCQPRRVRGRQAKALRRHARSVQRLGDKRAVLDDRVNPKADAQRVLLADVRMEEPNRFVITVE